MKIILIKFLFVITLLSVADCYAEDEATNKSTTLIDDTEGFLFDAHVTLDKEVEELIHTKQKYLAGIQKSDGSWRTGYGSNNMGEIAYCILALMVNGNVPGEGEFGGNISKGIQFLLDNQQSSGLICAPKKPKAPMYQHALAALALTEAYGMTRNPRIRTGLIKAINLISAKQHSRGGWRYNPKPESGDISATVMQVMALRAAIEAGVYVPKEVMEKALKFIKNCYNPKDKGFGYVNSKGKAGFARTGAGVTSLQTCGIVDGEMVDNSIKYMSKNAFEEKHHFLYGHYYGSVAFYHRGGKAWKNYYPKIKQVIKDGWEKKKYRSSLDISWTIMIMGVPFRYLPIYQR